MLQEYLRAENVDEFEVAYCRYVIADISRGRAAYRYRCYARQYELACYQYDLADDDYRSVLDRGESGERQHERVLDRYDLLCDLGDLIANQYAQLERRNRRATVLGQDFSRVAETRLADMTVRLTAGT